ncbi:hypothetical protein ACFL0V_05950 [Nanoarchaeota archaeon]
MQLLTKEEIQRRSVLIAILHKLHELYASKKEILEKDWIKLFNEGQLDDVQQLHTKTKQLVKQQIRTVDQLISLFKKEQGELVVDAGKNADYVSLVKHHVGFAELKQVGADVEDIIRSFDRYGWLLKEQERILKEVRGQGQQAYGEKDLRKWLEEEFKLLEHVQPFWHDWELIVVKVEKLLENIDKLTEEEYNMVQRDIALLLEKYHKEYSDDFTASQLGTELAVNLYIHPVKELDWERGIPVAVVNIDMTACNNLDESHKLGDEMIKVGYEYLIRKLDRSFTRVDTGKEIPSDGVVTVLGRTRYKIVGVPKEEIVDALQHIHDTDAIMKELSKPSRQGDRYLKGADEDPIRAIQAKKFKSLNTRMVVGYHDLAPLHTGKVFLKQVDELTGVRAKLEGEVPLDQRSDLESRKQELLGLIKKTEKFMAADVDGAIKKAAGRAEYLEKEMYDHLKDQKLKEIQTMEEADGIPILPTPYYAAEQRKIENTVLRRFPEILVYDGTTPDEYYGRNYIPEKEFEGLMIKRIGHQLGLDGFLTRGFYEVLGATRVGKDGKLLPQDAARLKMWKERFYTDVLQKRHWEKNYELRMTQSLREKAYDEVLSKMTWIEGAQIMTFIEIDGFNAFNKIYRPDPDDTYYHTMLKVLYDRFEETINNVRDEYQMELRMTKQGDEIWISYPRRRPSGEDVTEKEHRKFLQSVHDSFVRRGDEGYAVKNFMTAQWIPLLILHREKTGEHLRRAVGNAQKVFFVNNAKYSPKASQEAPYIGMNDENANSLLSLNSKVAFYTKFHHNNDEENMDRWKVLDGVRDTSGLGIFGPEKFKYSEMLFKETVKLTLGGGSVRSFTGRIVRVGTTMGYVGFDNAVILKTSEEVEELRKELNKAVEKVREDIGRGGYHNLEKKYVKI